MTASEIPRDQSWDSTLAAIADGYVFIGNRCRRYESDIFRARLLGKRAVCIHGREAAELFYDSTKLQRHGAIPRRVTTSLFGTTGVQTLDDEAHRHRKAAFMSLMTPESIENLMRRTREHWRRAIRSWQGKDAVVVFDEAAALVTRATCAWAGVPLAEREVEARARDFVSMVDAFGGVGPRLWKGKLARHRAEAWIEEHVEDVRRGVLAVDPSSALCVMAHHRELDGQLLDARTAAVEVINVIRPTVAIAWYIAFAALALHAYPEARARVAGDGGNFPYTDWFVQEVRRFYPFAPYLGASVRAPFEWRRHRFEPGTLVLLDVYGTNHDPALWDAPDEFRPERFEGWRGDRFALIPQGGGDPRTGHRCAGEWITMHHVALALHFLARCITYEVTPGQDLSFELARMPTRPKSGVVIRRVRATPALEHDAPALPSRTAAEEAGAV